MRTGEGWHQIWTGRAKHYFERDLNGVYFNSLCDPGSIYTNGLNDGGGDPRAKQCGSCLQILKTRENDGTK